MRRYQWTSILRDGLLGWMFSDGLGEESGRAASTYLRLSRLGNARSLREGLGATFEEQLHLLIAHAGQLGQ
jgi:hypothetical protein